MSHRAWHEVSMWPIRLILLILPSSRLSKPRDCLFLLFFFFFFTLASSTANFFHLLFQNPSEPSLTLHSCTNHMDPGDGHVRNWSRVGQMGILARPIPAAWLSSRYLASLGSCFLLCEMKIIFSFASTHRGAWGSKEVCANQNSLKTLKWCKTFNC